MKGVSEAAATAAAAPMLLSNGISSSRDGCQVTHTHVCVCVCVCMRVCKYVERGANQGFPVSSKERCYGNRQPCHTLNSRDTPSCPPVLATSLFCTNFQFRPTYCSYMPSSLLTARTRCCPWVDSRARACGGLGHRAAHMPCTASGWKYTRSAGTCPAQAS